MGDYEITCVRQDELKRITHVGILTKEGKRLYKVSTIIELYRSGHTFFTFKANIKATVFPKQNDPNRPYFLTTHKDETRENNLDFLPHCTSDYVFMS